MSAPVEKLWLAGHHVYHYHRVGSTNRVAGQLAARQDSEGLVVIADEQLRGEGRQGSTWHSPRGGLWCSVVLDIPGQRHFAFLYPLIAAVTIAEVLTSHQGCPAMLRWPNDIVVGKKKIGGVMCKTGFLAASRQKAILGVGVNLNNTSFPPDLCERATSLLLEVGRQTSPLRFLGHLLPLLDFLFDQARTNTSLLMGQMQDALPYVGQWVQLKGAQGNRIVRLLEIDKQGRLVVRTGDGRRERMGPWDFEPMPPVHRSEKTGVRKEQQEW